MTTALWLLLIGILAALAWLVRHNLRKWQARQLAEEERFAEFMKATAGATQLKDSPVSPAAPHLPPPPTAPLPVAPLPAGGLAQQKMLFEAAHKAGEAGEPALAIQLYGRLLARYPATTLAAPARAAVEALKKKLPK
jgi:hypothetical protein